jgi:hypothetical protein
MPYINDDSISLVLYGDVPLIRQSTLENLIVQAQKSGVALLSVMRKVLSDRTCKTFGLVEFMRVPLPAARMMVLMLFIIVFYSTMGYNALPLEI